MWHVESNIFVELICVIATDVIIQSTRSKVNISTIKTKGVQYCVAIK